MNRDFLATDARIHDKWESFWDRRQITIPEKKLFTADDRIFTVGSCFAYEIKKALIEHGVTCLPDYAHMQPDRSRVRLENDEDVPLFHLQHYNTYTVLGEFERIAGLWTQDPDDYWTVTRGSPWRGETAYQDPYRRRLYGRTVEDLHAINAELDDVYRQGFNEATAFFFTFGMTEVFRQKGNGRVVCQRPLYAGGGGLDETEFYMSSYADNLANIEKLIRIIRSAKPDAKIVMTVSPVPLARSFSGRDVTIATTESKAILRAVLGEVSRRHDVLYFPSYEAITWQGIDQVFGGYDNRHVHDEKVHNIMKAFVEAHFDLPEQPGATEPDDQPRPNDADVSEAPTTPVVDLPNDGLAEVSGFVMDGAQKIYRPTHRTGEWGRPFATNDAQLARFVAENPVRRNALAAFVKEFAASLPAGARVLDAGAGSMPYSALLAHTQYMTLDWPNSVHGRKPDIVGDLSKPVQAPDESFDAVLCTEVLEHIFDVPSAISEVHRLLQPGGRLAGTTPFLIQLHEQPYDYWRPTAYALEQSLAQAGFTDIQVQPLTGYFGSLAVMLRWMPLMTGATNAITSAPQWQELYGLTSKAAEWLVEHAHQLDELFDPAKLMPAGYAFTATKSAEVGVPVKSAGADEEAILPGRQFTPADLAVLDEARTWLVQDGLSATPLMLATLAQVPEIELHETAQAVLAEVIAVLLDACENGQMADAIAVFADCPPDLAELALALLSAAFFPDEQIDPAAFDDSATLCFSLFVAVAGRPLAALVSVAFPRRYGAEFAREFHAGLQALADEFDVAIAGGDTNTWDGPLVASVTVIGEAADRGPVRRSGARAGDWIMVTGSFGGSIAGHHHSFRPRVRA